MIERAEEKRRSGMGKMMRNGYNRDTFRQISPAFVPSISVFKITKIGILYDEIQIIRTNTGRIQTMTDRKEVIPTVIFLCGDPFLLHASNDLTIPQQTG